MSKRENKSSLRLMSFGMSVSLHALFVLSVPASIHLSSDHAIHQSKFVLLELMQPAIPAVPVKTPKTEMLQQNVGKTVPRQDHKAPPPKSWDDQMFRQKQSQLEQRIRKIKRGLKSIENKQKQSSALKISGGDRDQSALLLKQPAWKDYLDRVRKRVLDEWYPRIVDSERSLSQSEVRIDFLVDQQGVVKSFKAASFQGSEKFKDICLEAFRAALPFEPLKGAAHTQHLKRDYDVSLFFYYE